MPPHSWSITIFLYKSSLYHTAHGKSIKEQPEPKCQKQPRTLLSGGLKVLGMFPNRLRHIRGPETRRGRAAAAPRCIIQPGIRPRCGEPRMSDTANQPEERAGTDTGAGRQRSEPRTNYIFYILTLRRSGRRAAVSQAAKWWMASENSMLCTVL